MVFLYSLFHRNLIIAVKLCKKYLKNVARKGSLNCALIVEILQILFSVINSDCVVEKYVTPPSYDVFVIISLMMVTISLHWSLVLLIAFTAFALLLTLIVLLKLGQDTKHDIYYSRDGLAYKIIDL